MGAPLILNLFVASVIPVVKIIIICGTGALCARKGLLTSDGRRVLGSLGFLLFNPCLVFTKLGRTVTPGRLLHWFPLILNTGISTLLGLGLGYATVRAVPPPHELRNTVVVSIALGNLGNLPLVIVATLAQSSSSVLHGIPPDQASDLAISYVVIGLLIPLVAHATIGFQMLRKQPHEHRLSSREEAAAEAVKRAVPESGGSVSEPGSRGDNGDGDGMGGSVPASLTGLGAGAASGSSASLDGGGSSVQLVSLRAEESDAEPLIGLEAERSSGEWLHGGKGLPVTAGDAVEDAGLGRQLAAPSMRSGGSVRFCLPSVSGLAQEPAIACLEADGHTTTSFAPPVDGGVTRLPAVGSASSITAVPMHRNNSSVRFQVPQDAAAPPAVDEAALSPPARSSSSVRFHVPEALPSPGPGPGPEREGMPLLASCSSSQRPCGSMASMRTASSSRFSFRSMRSGSLRDAFPRFFGAASSGTLLLYSSPSMARAVVGRWRHRHDLRSAAKAVWREATSPPLLAVILAVIVACIRPLQKVFFGPGAPLAVVADALSMLGDCTIPAILLNLGATLSNGPGVAKVPARVTVSVALVRLALLPVLGGGLVLGAYAARLYEAPDPIYLLVLLIQQTAPTAIMVHTMASLHSNCDAEVSAILFWSYIVSILIIPLWLTLFLYAVQQLFRGG